MAKGITSTGAAQRQAGDVEHGSSSPGWPFAIAWAVDPSRWGWASLALRGEKYYWQGNLLHARVSAGLKKCLRDIPVRLVY